MAELHVLRSPGPGPPGQGVEAGSRKTLPPFSRLETLLMVQCARERCKDVSSWVGTSRVGHCRGKSRNVGTKFNPCSP